MSNPILTPHPPPPTTARRVCTPSPLVRGVQAGWRGVGGQYFGRRHAPDTALYSTYVSTLCLEEACGKNRGGE
jgi:hypothetical protein